MMEETQRSFNLWKVLLILTRRKRFIISFVLVCTALAIVAALVLPKWYRAKTSILPSQNEQSLGLSGNFAQFSMTTAGFELPVMATPSDVYAVMLRSETVGRAVIQELNLQAHFGLTSMQKSLMELKDRTTVKVSGEGIIELYYVDRSPDMAARIANSYISQLDVLNRRVRAGKAKSDREFIEGRLVTTKATLDSAKARLLRFQVDNNAVDLDRQRDLAIDAASGIKSELALKSVTLDVKRKTYSADHPEVKRLELEVQELNRQLTTLESGGGTRSYLNLPLDRIPELAVRYSELRAETDLQEKVYILLTELYEEARIKEQKDTPTISVLETAFAPEIKYRPQRTIIVLVTFLASMVLAVFVSLFADYLEDLRRTSPSDFELMDEARKRITGKTGYSDT
jgi:uncharacterized protein involved in exopolysaccharide biosynthesis